MSNYPGPHNATKYLSLCLTGMDTYVAAYLKLRAVITPPCERELISLWTVLTMAQKREAATIALSSAN